MSLSFFVGDLEEPRACRLECFLEGVLDELLGLDLDGDRRRLDRLLDVALIASLTSP